MHTRFALRVSAALALTLLVACGGGGDAGQGAAPGANANPGGGSAGNLQAEIDRVFPFTPNQPLDVLFACTRSNSRLSYYFGLSPNGVLDVFFETDTLQRVSFSGSYTHAGGTLRLLALNNNILPLDESSTRIAPRLGLVGEFDTPNMRCVAVAHGHDSAASTAFARYRCPTINAGAGGSEENVFEFNDSSSPFAITFRGGIFRQRDYWATFNGQPIVARGVGLYRRIGELFYADFGNQFSDHNQIKGRFAAGDAQLTVEQLEPAAGACTRR
jgi:hypothetical protein